MNLQRSIMMMLLVFSFVSGFGQGTADQQKAKETDRIVEMEIIRPALRQAAEKNTVPAWDAIFSVIAEKYDRTVADRNVTRQQIFNYYGKDWPAFAKALVRYTEKYEDKNDIKLMHKNAESVLNASDDIGELKIALSWIKDAVEKEPEEYVAYRKTYDALTKKIEGQ
jgi:hypothetical protein